MAEAETKRPQHYVLAADHSHQVLVTMSEDQFARNWHGRICSYSSSATVGVPVKDCPDFDAWLDEQHADKRRDGFDERHLSNFRAAQAARFPVAPRMEAA